MSVTIKEQSEALQAASRERLPAEVGATFARDRDALVASGASSRAVAAGDVIADFTLTAANGEDVSLAQLLAEGPVVLVFYRGGWCPFCNLALRHYQTELAPQLEHRGVRLAAISPQKPDDSLSTAEKHSLQFPVLSDAGARVARSLGIAFKPVAEVLEAQRALGLDITQGNAEGSTDLPMPTVLIVGRDRVVHFADVQPDYTSRTEVPAILSALAELESQPSLAGGA
jgi:peroxiredoxin